MLAYYIALKRGREIGAKWKLVPPGIDVLITHGPPFGILDKFDGRRIGCRNLRAEMKRIRPFLHIFGHVHESYGFYHDSQLGINYFNVAICDERYRPTRPPTEILVKLR